MNTTKKFYIISQEECQTCKGVGEVYNQAWEEFDARWKEVERAYNAQSLTREGYYETIDLPDGKAFGRLHGAEFRQCPTCQGKGTDIRQVELTEALAELGFTPALLRRVGEIEERFEAEETKWTGLTN